MHIVLWLLIIFLFFGCYWGYSPAGRTMFVGHTPSIPAILAIVLIVLLLTGRI